MLITRCDGQDPRSMSTDIIVSYDGTSNDDDALALGRMLARGGASLALAYVRHSREFDPRREELAQHDAERRLEQGAAGLGDATLPRHIVVSASTWEGLADLAAAEGASVIVFGSDYRTPPGSVAPGTTAQHLLEGGSVAIAVAPAGLRAEREATIRSVSVSPDESDPAARDTATALAERLGAELAEDGASAADLIVIGSQPGAPSGRIRSADPLGRGLTRRAGRCCSCPLGVRSRCSSTVPCCERDPFIPMSRTPDLTLDRRPC
jgi:nucleotide-binding universal stress UspA family protein